MEVKRIYEEDLQIARSLINRDEMVTRKFFYQQCYPLFKSIFDNYYTDCNDCKEFIDEIYILVLTPSRSTGHCQLENFRGESSLKTWMKVTALYYCYSQYEKKERMPMVSLFVDESQENEDVTDRFIEKNASTNIELGNLDRQDIDMLLSMMPNARYRELIRLRYVECLSNEETAARLGMSMANYYNKHKSAKEQYLAIYGKEENHG